MQLTDSDILEFQSMCKKHYGLELSWEEAQGHAINFVRLMQLTYQPMTLDEHEAVKQLDESKPDEPARPEAL